MRTIGNADIVKIGTILSEHIDGLVRDGRASMQIDHGQFVTVGQVGYGLVVDVRAHLGDEHLNVTTALRQLLNAMLGYFITPRNVDALQLKAPFAVNTRLESRKQRITIADKPQESHRSIGYVNARAQIQTLQLVTVLT